MGPARAAVDTKDTNDIRVPWRLIKQPNHLSNRRRSMPNEPNEASERQLDQYKNLIDEQHQIPHLSERQIGEYDMNNSDGMFQEEEGIYDSSPEREF